MEHTWLSGPKDGEVIDLINCGSVSVAVQRRLPVAYFSTGKDENFFAPAYDVEVWGCNISRTGKHFLIKQGIRLDDPFFNNNADGGMR